MRNNMEKADFYQNFQSFLKFLFIIPASIFITVVLFRVIPKQENKIPPAIVQISPTVAILPEKQASSSASLNLTGPFVCNFSQNPLTVQGYIKNKQIFVQMRNQNTVSNFLLKDDCFYRWENGLSAGEKTCGLQPVLGLIEPLINSGLLNKDMLSQFNSSLDVNTVKGIMQSCKKEEIQDESVFIVPINISFKEASLPM